MVLPARFRFYIVLLGVCGLALLVLHRSLSGSEKTALDYQKYKISGRRNKNGRLKPADNINDLLPLTQPVEHLEKQKERESQIRAEMHQKINRNTRFRLNLDGNLVVPDEKKTVNDMNSDLLNSNSKWLFENSVLKVNLPHRIIHLDLKGAPPLMTYYSRLFSLLKDLGATGILMEYEDMFPYWQPITSLAAYNAYSSSDILKILQLAKYNNLEVIPLVQTFGHMEFVLKLDEYKNLREVPEYPQVICPSNNHSLAIIKLMIDQVLTLHREAKWIHIGSDEVYNIGECSLCKSRLVKNYWDTNTLFLSHVKTVAAYVKNKHVQPIMWDDMFRVIPEEQIRSSEIAKFVEIMVWQYSENIEDKLTPEIWEKYGVLFSPVWAASSFKGATGPSQYITDVFYHLQNHHSWLKAIKKYENKVNFRGIVMTGWQRFDHFAVLCELLPVGIPSIAINLLYVQHGKIDSEVMKKVQDILLCDNNLGLKQNFTVDEVICGFPGAKIYKGAQRLVKVKHELQKLRKNSHLVGWMADYNLVKSFSSPAHIEIGTRKLKELAVNTTLLNTFMQNVMPDVYDSYTISEWLQTFMEPIKQELEKVQRNAVRLLKFDTWPRRPLGYQINEHVP
ncbi:hexosaminidase D-like [Limulus polyphemus]|uniref:beta-N-acetylhexosaminidase n=1 Tax=Limulus polyphemus TaxID=6850 RepID=A0ABM1BIS1_LIMPO|nr:hexosaminidase D-like [Limulus polyphemus]XP_013782817.1 hexosaminidase D-like [Limulus polyphemus]XP_022250855.1 hexosaminidase D-like [Limulus polyphemus]XP_022250856.1 hexosaminidase D-like [Limulus polyphemus]